MVRPAPWKNDPACGHEVACEFQTHYCTYIRVPRLLTLQSGAGSPDEVLFVLGLQAAELWLKVLLTDLKRVLDRTQPERHGAFEPLKLLHRSSEILTLLDRQFEALESSLAGVTVSLGPPASVQLDQLGELGGELYRRQDFRSLGEFESLQPAHTPGQARDHETRKFQEAARTVVVRARAMGLRFDAFCAGLEFGDGLDYAAALSLDQLLDLQDGPKAGWTRVGEAPAAIASSEPVSADELMFIVTHQAFELWFKAILQALDLTVAGLLSDPPDVENAIRRLRRVVAIQRLLVRQIQIPATMLPLDFLRFRNEIRHEDGRDYYRGLSPSSGSESFQFREIEILAGLRDDPSFRAFLKGNEALHIRFLIPSEDRRLNEPTLGEAYERLVKQRGLDDLVEVFKAADEENPHRDLAELGDLLLEFDQFFKLWRVSHVSMVERMIGNRSGTGFLGPEYLRETAGLGRQDSGRLLPEDQTRPRFFARLFEARSRLTAY